MSNKALLHIDDHSISKKDILSAIDQEIITLHDTGNINRVMSVLNGLSEVESVSGHAKAKLLWASNEWFKQNEPDKDFADHVADTTTLNRTVVDRYITVQRFIEDMTIPKEITERPMRDLIPIAKTLAQGYDISKEQWRKIKLAANDGELRDVLRKIKGKSERKSAKVLKLERDGSINLYIKGKPKKFIGFLNVKDAETDNDVAEMIERIKNGAGMVEE